MKKQKHLKRADVRHILEKSPYALIFRCTQTSMRTMGFWCPLCFEIHNHGLDTQPFRISSRVPHCGKNQDWGYYCRRKSEGWLDNKFKGLVGAYYVYWDGTINPKFKNP